MSGWKAVRTLAVYDTKREWLGQLLTFVFALYMGGMCGLNLEGLLTEADTPRSLYAMVDWLYLLGLPVCGLSFTRTSWKVSREDCYGKKIALWRTMPIPLATILKARMLRGYAVLPVSGLAFFLLQYAAAPSIRETYSLADWLIASAIWFCYAAAANAVFIWMELVCSGKRYVIFYLVYMVAITVAVSGLALVDVSLFRLIMDAIVAGQAAGLAAAPVVALAAVLVGYRVTLSAMRRRTYSF